MQEPRTYERTAYEAKLDVAYGVCFNEINARFYRHLDLIFGFIGLFGGTAVFTAAIGDWQGVSLVAGALVAASAIFERLIRPVEQALRHDEMTRRFVELRVLIEGQPGMSIEAINSGLYALQGSGPSGIASLAPIAYNQVVTSAGRTDFQIEISFWQRLVAVLA